MRKSIAVFFCFFVALGFFWSWSCVQIEAKEEVARSELRPALQQIDIALVLDNSGSMKANDPNFLTKEVVTNFMVGFGVTSRLAMIIFDQDARLVEPLTEVTGLVARANFLKRLEQVNYQGLFSDSPAGIERAIYELKLNGRINARKVIILLTDGIVDTGEQARDFEKAKWLRENLTQECRNAGIKIFGIAFSDKADFSLIETLAFKTRGEYFRAYTAEDIQIVFNKISQLIISLPAESKPTVDRAAVHSTAGGKVPTAVSAPPESADIQSKIPSPTAESVGAPQKIPTQLQKPDSLMLILLIGIFVLLAAIVLIMALNRKAKASAGAVVDRSHRDRHAPPMPRAELIDVKNITRRKTLQVSKDIIKIGRDENSDVAISEETVSSLHATIEYQDGFFYLEDQRSKNKTYLNGEQVAPYSPKKLKSGDVITINVYKFIFILPDLIPSGETVIDLSGKPERRTEVDTVVSGQVITARDGSVMPQALMIDVKNITGKKTLVLKKSVIKIGRGVHNDIAIDQHSISGSHAVIQFKDGSFYLEDQRSKNKTLLNGDEIAPHTPMKLKSGDEIVFDTYKFIFLLEQQTPSGDTDESW